MEEILNHLLLVFLCNWEILCLKAHVNPRCIARLVLQRKTFCVVETRCLQCVESVFVNLPQFAKSGLKESLNSFFWYFSLYLFGYFGLLLSLFVSVSVCFTAVVMSTGKYVCKLQLQELYCSSFTLHVILEIT